MASQTARDRIEHVVVLMLENRSFDHLLGFLEHPNLPRLEPGSHVNRLVPDDVSSEGYGVIDDAEYSLPVDPPHSHLSVMKQFHGRRPKMDGFVAAYAEKATGNERVPIIHWWRIEALQLGILAALTVASQIWAHDWAGAAGIGVALAAIVTLVLLWLRPILERWWRAEALAVAIAIAFGLVSRLLGAGWIVAAPTAVALAIAVTFLLLRIRSRPLYRHPDSTEEALRVARQIMSCMPDRRIPVLGTLAREFGVCTRWHCSVPGETWPNRNFAIAATSDGTTGIEIGFYESRTVFELLEHAGKTWRIYHDGMAQAMAFRRLWEEGAENWFDISSFAEHVAANRLADYSFIEPSHMGPRSNSQHPGNNLDPQDGVYDFERGEALIASIYEALRTSPDVFERTIFLITYDEHGGLFDHRPPPTDAVAPTLRKAAVSTTRRFVSLFVTYRGTRFDFRTLGPRVPAVVVSPWIARGRVDDTLYDHSSIVATARAVFAPTAPALTRRDRRANTFERLVDELAEPRSPEDLPRLPVSPETLSERTGAPGRVPAGAPAPGPVPDLVAQLALLADDVNRELDRLEAPESASLSTEAVAAARLEGSEPDASERAAGRVRARAERRRSGLE